MATRSIIWHWSCGRCCTVQTM